MRERYGGVERRRGTMLDRIGEQLKHLNRDHESNVVAGDSSRDKVYLLHPPTLEVVLRREGTGDGGEERRRRSGRGGRRKHVGKKLKKRKRRKRGRWRRRRRRRRRVTQQCQQAEEERT